MGPDDMTPPEEVPPTGAVVGSIVVLCLLLAAFLCAWWWDFHGFWHGAATTALAFRAWRRRPWTKEGA